MYVRTNVITPPGVTTSVSISQLKSVLDKATYTLYLHNSHFKDPLFKLSRTEYEIVPPGLDSSFGIATRYGLEGPRIDSR